MYDPNNKKHRTVIVLGMRSGSSMISGVLSKLGVCMGERLLKATHANPFGHYEDLDFLELNEDILDAAGGSWDNPPPISAILDQKSKFEKRIKSLIERKEKNLVWGWKDPRTVYTLDLYIPQLKDIRIVWCDRQTSSTAKSLSNRDYTNLADNIRLIREYKTRVKQINKHNLLVHRILYDKALRHPEKTVNDLIKFLDISPDAEQIRRAKKFIMPKTRVILESKKKRAGDVIAKIIPITKINNNKSGLRTRKIFFLCEGVNVPASRFRVFQWLQHLTEDDIPYQVYCSYPEKYQGSKSKNPLVKGITKIFLDIARFTTRTRDVLSIPKDSFVFLQRDLLSKKTKILERLLFYKTKNVVFDFDDAIFLQNKKKINYILKHSSRVIVGNMYLAAYAKKKNSNVCVIPTVIKVKKILPNRLTKKGKNRLTVGWIGTSSNLPELEALRTLLLKTYNQHPFTLKIVSDSKSRLDFSPIPTQQVRWSKEKEDEQVSSFDIGIMPLRDTRWNKGKCGFKILQYMAAGVPVIASSIGINKDIILHNKTGYLVQSDDEWIKHLLSLLKNKSKREQFRNLGFKRVSNHFSTKAYYTKWKNFVFTDQDEKA